MTKSNKRIILISLSLAVMILLAIQRKFTIYAEVPSLTSTLNSSCSCSLTDLISYGIESPNNSINDIVGCPSPDKSTRQVLGEKGIRLSQYAKGISINGDLLLKECDTQGGTLYTCDSCPSKLNFLCINENRPKCSSASPIPPVNPPTDSCNISPDQKQQSQVIRDKIKSKYGFTINDSNVCQSVSCNVNAPFSPTELQEIQDTLDSFPSCFVSKLKLEPNRAIGGQTKDRKDFLESALDYVQEKSCCPTKLADGSDFANLGFYYDNGYNGVSICGDNYKRAGATLRELLTHELTHAWQYGPFSLPIPAIGPLEGIDGAYANPGVVDWLNKTGYQIIGGTCIPVLGCSGGSRLGAVPNDVPTDYAKVSPLEDMAESVRLYVTNPQELKNKSQRRYDFVKSNIMCGTEY